MMICNTKHSHTFIISRIIIGLILFLLIIGCESSQEIAQTEKKQLSIIAGESTMMQEIVTYAAMAPSGHNTQPWKFYIGTDSIIISPDYSRRLPAVDPDDRELFISLGCALENLVVAAEHFGYSAKVSFNFTKEYEETIVIELKKSSVTPTGLFEQIKLRQTTRNQYNRKSVPALELDSIKHFLAGNCVQNQIVTDSISVNEIIQLVEEGNNRQFEDDRFMDELKFWLRFSQSEAEEKLDGLTSGSTGNPSVPRWLGKLYMNLFFSADDQNEKDEIFIRSSAGIILFYTKTNNKLAWIETGRAYERFSLLTTKMNIKCTFINQPVEITDLNKLLLKAMGLSNGCPQLLLRFGYSDKMPRSPRRKLNDVMVTKTTVEK